MVGVKLMVKIPLKTIETLGALIRNYGHVLALMFFHHRGTEDTENFLFLLIVKQAIYKKICLCALGDSVVRPVSSRADNTLPYL